MTTAVDDVIRPFRDSDITVTRRWYRVPWGTPTLGFPSAFYSAHYEAFPWLDRDVGEVYPSPIRYTRNAAPSGMTYDHVCGTADQFARGALYDPTFNSHPDEYWIPRCCGRVVPPGQGVMELGGECGDVFVGVDPTAGGLLLGGEAGDVIDGIDPTAGGVQLGGAAGESRDFTDPTAGGLLLGGEVGDVIDGIDPTAGGVQLGGNVGDGEENIDPTAGGLLLGGEAGDVLDFTDATAGGLELGGESGYSRDFTDATAGGLELGGESGYSRDFTDATAGGLELGGESGYSRDFTDPTAGGLELGGAAGDVYTPPDVEPGATCETAGDVGLDETHGATISAPAVQWWKIEGSAAGTYHITTTNVQEASGAQFSLLEGSGCDEVTPITPTHPETNCWQFTKGGGGILFLTFSTTSGGPEAYTFNVSAGAC